MDPSAPFPLGPFIDAAGFSAAAPTIDAVDVFAALAPPENPAPPQLDPAAPTHPPYAEMICAAITALKERDGSSKRAIAKFIDEAYTGLPTTHSALLTYHLKRLKNSGLVVMVKKSYKLAPPGSDNNGGDASLLAGDGPGPKRGRGRPPKTKPDPAQLDPVQPNAVQPVLAALGLVDEYTEKKAPGRPRKSVSMTAVHGGAEAATLGNGGPVVAKKRPGRPPGRRPIASVNGPNGKRRPGRPAKAQSVPLIVPYATADIPKPRGRPKLVPGAAGNGGVKRRGRPRKVVGEVKVKKATGKSPGRPKKNATTATSDVAVVELKKKLEYFKTKVMHVVEVLKPQLSTQSSISAITAVQELEVLASLDISGPLPVEALVQVPVQLQIPIQQHLPQNPEPIW